MIDHPYQLRRIELRDFKSVAHASVELRPLTVVVGANSSGKSTLLQSILAVTQAVRSGAASAEFPLNGEFVRLGTYDETRNFLASRSDSPMEIAFELVETPPHSARGEDGEPLMQVAWRAFIEDGRATASSDEPTVGSGGFARLTSIQIELGSMMAASDDQPMRLLSCDITSLGSGADLTDDLQVMSRRARLTRLSGTGRSLTKAAGRVQDWSSGVSHAIDAIALSGGVPQAVLRQVSRFDILAETWWSVASDLLEETLDEEKLRLRESGPLGEPGLAAVTQAASDLETLLEGEPSEESTDAELAGVTVGTDAPDRHFLRRLGTLNEESRQAIAENMVQLGEAEFRTRLRGQLGEREWASEHVLVELAGAAGSELFRSGFISQRFFRTAVRYLGPLREAPHVLYDPGPSKLDLGPKGEFAAAVLHAQVHRSVLTPLPDGHSRSMRLGEALNLWLAEFGLAQRARSEDRGRIGIGLSVTPPNLDREVDLTSVGVGVSQILPVLLLCLLAEPGSLLVLEQPELHLHPKLQQDLADFLLACTRTGRQLVIETHSEHLVNRLRYRIAADDSSTTQQLVGLVFAESDGGVTRYREPEINAYGGLGEDWPAGFLDLTAREAQDLVRTSLAKRKRQPESDIGESHGQI